MLIAQLLPHKSFDRSAVQSASGTYVPRNRFRSMTRSAQPHPDRCRAQRRDVQEFLERGGVALVVPVATSPVRSACDFQQPHKICGDIPIADNAMKG